MPVYQYEGKHYELPDGLSKEQAISTIEKHLGKSGSMMDSISDAMKNVSVPESVKKGAAMVPEFMGEVGKTLGTLFTPGMEKPSATAETSTSIGTGLAGMVGGLPPAALKSVNNMAQGEPAEFEKNYSDAIDRFTYAPKTEEGAEGSKLAGDFINRNLVPLGPVASELGGALTHAGAAFDYARGTRGPKGKPKTLDVAGSAEDLLTPKPTAPNPMPPGVQPTVARDGSMAYRNQRPLFDTETVTEKLQNGKVNDVVPGAASQFDPFQEQSPYVARRGTSGQMDLPIPDPNELPPVIRQDSRGIGTTGLEDPGLVQAVRNGAPQDVRVFDEMQQQLRSGQTEGVDFPKNNGMDTVVGQLADQAGRRDTTSMYQDLSRQANAERQHGQAYNELIAQEGAAEKARLEEDARKQALEEQQRAQAAERAQGDVTRRQQILQDEVKRQQSLDFNAAERARQERAPVPGLDNARENAAYEKVQAEVAADPRVVDASERMDKGVELLRKAQEAVARGELSEAHLKRIDKDLKGLQEVLDFMKANAEYEALLRAKEEAQGGRGGAEVKQTGLEELPKEPKPVKTDTRVGPKGPGRKQGGWILMEGKKQKAMQNLADKVDVDLKLGPIAPSHWTPAQAIEAARKAGDLAQNLVQRGINYLTKGGLYQALKTGNPVIRYVYERVSNADRLARAAIRDWIHDRLAPAMRALDDKAKGEIWTIIDLADMHEKAIDFEALARRGASEAQIHMAQEHLKGMQYTYDMMNKAMKAMGKDPIDRRTAYAAMRSTGDFRRLVFDKEGGNIVGIIGSDYRTGLNGLASRMAAKGFFVGNERYFGGMPRERGSANQAMMNALEVLSQNDPRVRDFVDVLHEIRTTEVYNFLNMKKHTMEKKGIFGMEGRKSWLSAEQNAKEGMKAQLNYMEAAIKWGHLAEAVADVKQVLNHPDVKMPFAKQWAEDYMYNALGFNPSDTGRAIEQAVALVFKHAGIGFSVGRQAMADIRTMTNSLLLTLNPRFWATNVVQPLQAMPGMKAMLIARGLDAGFDFGTGGTYLVEGGNTIMKKNSGQALTAVEKGAMDYAFSHHVYGSDLIEHSNRVSKDFLYRAEKVGNFVAGSVESSTRQLMYYSMVHLLKENGLSIKNGLFETAHNLTDMAMNNYSTTERAPIYNVGGPFGDLAANLASYKHNELSRLALFVRDAADHKSLRPVVAQMASSLAFTGIMGTVGFTTADQIYRLIMKMNGTPDSLTNRVFQLSEHVGKMMYDATGGKIDQPYLLSNGVPAMLGIDMSRSLGLTDVLPDSVGGAMFPGGSKLADVGKSLYDLTPLPGSNGSGFSEMNVKRAIHQVSPVIAAGPEDNAWFTKEKPEGTLSVRPRDLAGQAYRNKTDWWAKELGFTGINESVQRAKTYNIERESRDYSELRQGPLNSMRDSYFTKGKVSDSDVQSYLKYRGDLDTLTSDLTRFAMQQNMSAKELALFRDAASSSVGAQLKAQEYVQKFSK